MRSLLRVVLFVLMALAAIGISIDRASRSEAPAHRSCCAAKAKADGEQSVCNCGKVEGQGCCCSKRRAAGLASCGAACKCGDQSTGSAPPDMPQKTSLAAAALMHTQSGLERAAQDYAGVVLDDHYESPVHRIDPRPPRRRDAA